MTGIILRVRLAMTRTETAYFLADGIVTHEYALSDFDAAMAMAEAVRARIAGVPFDSVGHVSASFGVATWDHKEDSHALIKRADTALYKAKSSGRNCVAQAEDAA